MSPAVRRAEVVVLPLGARSGLWMLKAGLRLDTIAGLLIRGCCELDLLAVRLPLRDRRHHQLRRLVHAVRLRSF